MSDAQDMSRFPVTAVASTKMDTPSNHCLNAGVQFARRLQKRPLPPHRPLCAFQRPGDSRSQNRRHIGRTGRECVRGSSVASPAASPVVGLARRCGVDTTADDRPRGAKSTFCKKRRFRSRRFSLLISGAKGRFVQIAVLASIAAVWAFSGFPDRDRPPWGVPRNRPSRTERSLSHRLHVSARCL